ncbi:MAG: hypothetical protein WC732_02895 [Candidatus Omnitrophota bacterium]
MFIEPKAIQDLATHWNAEGALSIYLSTSPGELYRDFSLKLNSTIDSARRQLKELGSRALMKSAERLDRLDELLMQHFPSQKRGTFCIFLSPDLYRHFEIPVRLKERVVVESSFYTNPLISLLEEFPYYGILVFDRQRVRLFHYYMGTIRENSYIFHDYVLPHFNPTAGSWHGLAEKRLANKIEDTSQRHFKEVSSIVFKYFKFQEFDKLLIASREEEIDTIKKHLHSYLLQNLEGEFVADVKLSLEEIKRRAEKVMAAVREKREREKVEQILNESRRGKAVLGAEDVSYQLTQGKVRELVLNGDFHSEGFVCPQQHYFTARSEQKTCLLCHKPLGRENYLEDEITEEAFTQGSRIFHILNNKDRLLPQGIGAFLRY